MDIVRNHDERAGTLQMPFDEPPDRSRNCIGAVTGYDQDQTARFSGPRTQCNNSIAGWEQLLISYPWPDFIGRAEETDGKLIRQEPKGLLFWGPDDQQA